MRPTWRKYYRTNRDPCYPIDVNYMINISGIKVGKDAPLLVIAGPCVLESQSLADEIAEELISISRDAGVTLIFKGSFDKANRTSIKSKRGPGIKTGLGVLSNIKKNFDIPVTTDIHDSSQAAEVASVVDLIQIPAFLCRQTDLLVAAATTGVAVNVKKGQFLSPQEMSHVVAKLQEANCNNILLTERGTFFGYQRLVNDFIGLGDLMEIGPPVCFDVTHSTQLPGAGTSETAGRPDRASILAKAATAAGVHALFLECHPDPSSSVSDASTMQPLHSMRDLIMECAAIRDANSPKVS